MAASSPETIHAQFGEAFNAGDIDALCDLYEPNAVFIPEPSANPVTGIAGIREILASYLAMRSVIKIVRVSAHQNGDLALLRGKWSLRGTDADGNRIEIDGHSSELIRRQTDGTWRLVIDNPYGGD
jgi:ketosteroid isomerase-like protein